MSKYSAERRHVEPKILDYYLMSRYSAVRRQGEADEGQLEPKILDYPTQQAKLIPALAMAGKLWDV